MTEPTGIAPSPERTTPAAQSTIGETRLCGSCATLIRYHPTEQVWRHAALGFDHAPELAGSWAPRGRCEDPSCELHNILDRPLGDTERDPVIVTESELRLLDGNR
jgi:hypothetical protein